MWGTEARACALSISAACAACGDAPLSFPGGAIGGVVLSGLELSGTATVSADEEHADDAILFAIRARAGLSFDSIVCEAPLHETNGEVLFWNPIDALGDLVERPLQWNHTAPNFDSHVRVYAVLVSNVDEANRLNSIGLPPIQPGDLYGATDTIELRLCQSVIGPQRICPVDPMWSDWPAIEMKVVFQGCGARVGRCIYDGDPEGKRCLSSSSTLPTITSQYERECADSEGTYFPNRCPSEGLAGGCRYDVQHPDGSTLIDWYYAPRSPEQVAAICDWQDATFVSAPE